MAFRSGVNARHDAGAAGRSDGLAERARRAAGRGDRPVPDEVAPPAEGATGTGRLAEPERSGREPARPQVTVLAQIDQTFVQAFALVGEAIAGATDALLAGDREAAKALMARDEIVDAATREIGTLAQRRLVEGGTERTGTGTGTGASASGADPAAADPAAGAPLGGGAEEGPTTREERRELVAVLGMLPDLERSGDLAEHIARRAVRGLGAEMSARSRGLVERMGEVAASMWSATADTFAERSATGAGVVDAMDDELDDLHVTLTAELVAGTMSLPVAIELAMVARFYERFGDHAVNLARRMAALVGVGSDPRGWGAD